MECLPEELANALAAVWESSPNPPNIFEFLKEKKCVLPESIAPLLAVDQKYRWKTDKPLLVEDYLSHLPHLSGNQGLKLQLVIHEFTARRDAETLPSIEEYTTRFSELSDPLRSALAELVSAAGIPNEGLETSATIAYASNSEIGRFGRYRLTRILGEGEFGRVYLAFDEELERLVAIKVPTAKRFRKPEDSLQYLAEARTVASLDHPNIVPVYDMGRTEEGSVYVVSKFIEGCTLENWIKRDRTNHETTSKWLATIALALHHAHSQRLIHRDVKPGNILLEGDDLVPYLADFGLAIREDEFLREGKVAGTPAYMSPEQARGEGHRLDGRSDIFSLGVILYEMLTGQRPFRGSTPMELITQVTTAEPRPLRTYDPAIPPELERICMKALAKRASDRYPTALEFADDLLHWKQNPVQAPREMTIVPKGLRSFDVEDADFFLDLLPGPRARSGLPENLQFWKTRIEEPDPEKTFHVGLIYGPSGCGKSSLMKAGLLPRLSRSVVSVYLEATPDETEIRILRGLRKALPELPPELGLVESFVWLRQRKKSASKVVVILDQFEQWLHMHGAENEPELVKALRHCDGKYLQAIIMVRDDFAMAASRFMDAIDVPILQGKNFATVDLFDIDHAEKVLVKFGQAFGKLPQDHEKMTEDEAIFVGRVASGLAVEGKVVSVQIALFAEMVKGKPWTLQTLDDVGGTEGVGVNFLEETFGSRMANPKHRLHQQAARQVLAALLPEVGTDIKGHLQSYDSLLDAAGYTTRPTEFTDLLRILDGELRLITPMDPEGASFSESDSSSSLAHRYYQLTHDFLVPSLREWLTRKQRETKRGRAELKLAERAAAWKNLPENKQLPTLIEWFQIRRWTDKDRWNSTEQSLMRSAARVHTKTWGLSLIVASLIGMVVGYGFTQQRRRSQQEQITVTLDTLQKTLGPSIPFNIEKLVEMNQSEWIRAELRRRFEETIEPSERLSLAFALARFGQVEVDFLISQIDTIDDRDSMNLIDAMSNDFTRSLDGLRNAYRACDAPELHRSKARLALIALGIGDTALPVDAVEFEGCPDPGVRTHFIDQFPHWLFNLGDLIVKVEDSPSPALRSAFLLGLGQIPYKQIPSDEGKLVADLARAWYGLPDSTTHSAASWLLRQWEIPEPRIADANQIVTGRNWFLNSQGTNMVLVTPPPYLVDPQEKFRQQLAELSAGASQTLALPETVLRRALANYHLGNFSAAIEDLTVLASKDFPDPLVAIYRPLVLARLGRGSEAEDALATLLSQEDKGKADWNVRFYHWNSAGPMKPPADWQTVLSSPVVAEWDTKELRFGGPHGLPSDEINRDYFAAVATSRLLFASDSYPVTLTFDDGIRVWLDEEVIYENWSWNHAVPQTIVLQAQPGEHLLRVEYFQIDGGFALEWKPSEQMLAHYIPYVQTLVPLWLGRTEEAIRNYSQAIEDISSLDRSAIYNLARAAARIADAEPNGSATRQEFIGEALSLLEKWSTRDEADKTKMREELDLVALHQEDRFKQLVLRPSDVPTRPYWIAAREVTRGEFEAFINDVSYQGAKPKDISPDQKVSPTIFHPAQNVSWFDAVMYCNWLSIQEGLRPAYLGAESWKLDKNANGYRLPSESEWEFACRAGSKSEWFTGNEESMLESYCKVPTTLANVCGEKLPNALGIHDMHGNVWEWCEDRYERDLIRVFRGGSWLNGASLCRSASRITGVPALRDEDHDIGLRVALNCGISQSAASKQVSLSSAGR